MATLRASQFVFSLSKFMMHLNEFSRTTFSDVDCYQEEFVSSAGQKQSRSCDGNYSKNKI